MEKRYVEGDEYRKVNNRLKTLEDKVKFIMENTDKEIFEQTGMQEADSKWVKLQDLWDEQKKDVKDSIDYADDICKKMNWKEPTDKQEKIEEIISELNKRFWNRDSKIYYEATDKEILVDTTFLESWLRDKLKEL